MPKILVVSHDAGGAEVLSAWVQQNPEESYDYLLDGPAKKIFAQKLGQFENKSVEQLSVLINEVDWVLTGTSWGSELEKQAIRAAKQSGVKVVSFLDHWTNYPDRFELQGKTTLPDEIWVGDDEALELAKTFFSVNILKLVPNPYIKELKAKLSAETATRKESAGLNILYVCEPLEEHSLKEHGHPHHWGYTEFDAVRYFVTNLSKKLNAKKLPLEMIRIRLHPSENIEKYEKYKAIINEVKSLPVQLSQQNSLIADCVWSDWVVGCQSMAMVVGLIAGKEVYSAIPPEGAACVLPHKKILKFT